MSRQSNNSTMTDSRKNLGGRPEVASKQYKTTLSLEPEIHEWALELMKENGFGNRLSWYVSDLIRKARLESQRQKAELAALSAPHQPKD